MRAADDPAALRDRFDALAALLSRQRPRWRPRPFVERRLPWEDDFPEVGAWLRGLSDEAVERLDRGPAPADAPAAFRAWDAEARAFSEVDALIPTAAPQARRPQGVPARKWAQVQAFLHAALPELPGGATRVVDWCGGKGHLGRTLAATADLEVEVLERRADLCAAGRSLASDHGVPGVRFSAVDVLEDGARFLGPDAVAFGLHACGDLWRALLARAAERGAAAVIAPCCYHHLGGAPRYLPRSEAGRAQGLDLAQSHLRLAVAEERVARPAVARVRRREQAYRLGLDLLLREASGIDDYAPQGPFPKAMVDLPFEAFCRAASDRLERALPPRWDPDAALAAGEARAREVFALSQVRARYRRPLELWLVLDHAVAQLDRGRSVRLGTFCAPDVTPRNLMVATW